MMFVQKIDVIWTFSKGIGGGSKICSGSSFMEEHLSKAEKAEEEKEEEEEERSEETNQWPG
jgi:hypothetical protein